MRTRTICLAILLTAGMTLAPAVTRCQEGNGDYSPPDPVFPLPLWHDRPERGGFYAAGEFMLLRQTNPLKSQQVAIRGFNDFDGSIQAALNLINGLPPTTPIFPGKFFGNQQEALNSEQVGGPGTYQPGFKVGLGWKFANGLDVEFDWRHITTSKYSATASVVPRDFQAGANLENTFLFSPVFNFPTQFAGPASKIAVANPGVSGSSSSTASFSVGPGGSITVQNSNFIPPTISVVGPVSLFVSSSSVGAIIAPQAAYGIWNGATLMTISFIQRYDDFDFVGRIPIYQNDWARFYGLFGPRAAVLWERFQWRTVDVDVTLPSQTTTASATLSIGTVTNPGTTTATVIGPIASLLTTAGGLTSPGGGNSGQDDVAIYSNIVSNRLYGPMFGCGTECYLGNGFALSLDLRAAVLLDIVKERVKYERGDFAIAAQRGKTDYTIAPELDAMLNMWWYPIEGIQLRVGYEAMNFFNTISSPHPVDFNYGSLTPEWYKHTYRLIDGWNAGIGFVF